MARAVSGRARLEDELIGRTAGKFAETSQTDIRDRIDRVAIGGTTIQIRLSEVGEGDDSVKTLTDLRQSAKPSH